MPLETGRGPREKKQEGLGCHFALHGGHREDWMFKVTEQNAPAGPPRGHQPVASDTAPGDTSLLATILNEIISGPQPLIWNPGKDACRTQHLYGSQED